MKITRNQFLKLISAAALTLTGCGSKAQPANTESLVFSHHYKLDYAQQFTADCYEGGYTMLTIAESDARFLVMIEREKCGPDMKAALADSGIFYCYLDDFYSGNAEDIKLNALFQEMYRWIDDSIKLNVNEMLDAALRNTRLEMSAAERKQFYEKHIRNMSLVIDDDGNVSIELKRK